MAVAIPISANRLQWGDLKRKIASLSDVHEEDEVAEICRIDIGTVRKALAELPTRSGWWVRCNKSGKALRARSKTGAYRLVCLHGLTDWEWGQGQIVGEGLQP